MAEKSKLDCGFTLVTESIPHSPAISIGIWIPRGSRDEERKEAGITHFIEHLLFKGTKSRTAAEIAKEFDRIGGISDAFTTREYTCIYTKILKKDLINALDILSDIYINPLFDEGEIDKEKKVVLHEIKMVNDEPEEYIHDLLYQVMWEGSSLGNPILGYIDTISQITRDQVIRFFYDNYHRRPVIISASGNLDHKELENAINDKFKVTLGEEKQRTNSILKTGNKQLFKRKRLEQVHICLGFRSVSQSDPMRYAAYILNTVVGGGMSSRLFQKIREERGYAYSVYSFISCYSDTGVFGVYACTSSDLITKVLEIMAGEFKRLKDELVDEDEIESAKNQLKGHLLLGLESSENIMTKLGKNEIYFGRSISIEEINENIDRITSEEILKFSREILKSENLSIAAIGKIREKDLEKIFAF